MERTADDGRDHLDEVFVTLRGEPCLVLASLVCCGGQSISAPRNLTARFDAWRFFTGLIQDPSADFQIATPPADVAARDRQLDSARAGTVCRRMVPRAARLSLGLQPNCA